MLSFPYAEPILISDICVCQCRRY